jgi:hypothetical protein
MGYDVSFHPVPLALIHERLLPYVAGQGSIDDLVDRAAELAAIRFRANAWGLGVCELEPESRPDGFNTDLYIWGRPFFIADERSEDVSRSLDRYLATRLDDSDEVDKIACEMLGKLASRSKKGGADVLPSKEGVLPSAADRRKDIRWKIDLFRDAYRARRERRPVITPDGEPHDPNSLFGSDFPLAAMEFVSQLQPGWMARGYVWPTYLIDRAKLDIPPYVTNARAIFAPLVRDVPSLGSHLEATIHQNYTLGGYVPPQHVAEFRAFFETNLDALLDPASDDDWEDECRIALQKITEALDDAARREMGFVEASEIYSGPMGIMN